MSGEVIRLDLRLRRRMLIGTAVGAAAYLALIVAIYPSFKHDTSLDAMISANPTAAAAFGITGSITSPAGWLNANMYANFAPLLALLLTVGYGAAAIAGQDADGLLGLEATLPATRITLVLQKALTLLLVALVVPVVSLGTCLAGPYFELNPDRGALLEVSLALTLLAFDVGAAALLVGAFTGSRGAALGTASAGAAAAYLVSSLATISQPINAIRWLSPFFWAVGNNQLERGVGLASLAALGALGLVLTGATVLAFQYLDIH
jgi:ABC-2 type transport system permease protein